MTNHKGDNKQALVTGIRSTGEQHLGNYYGAMRGLVELQEQYEAHYFIADLHALTTHPKPESMRENVLRIAKNYLAAGLDPTRCTFYAQSSLADLIGELHTYLSMVMPLGDLLRCPTFKEKAKKHPDNVNYGLVGYPVLMASDVLIHKGQVVPVGEDQLVHLELARTIVRRFNGLYGETFPEPVPLSENAVRIPSLTGQGKMSKSDDEGSYISLQDEAETIQGKVKKAFSDPLRVYRKDPGHPSVEGCNVYHLHHYFTDQEVREELAAGCLSASIGCVACKARLAQSMAEVVEPLRERIAKLRDEEVLEVLAYGQQKARMSAQQVITEVRRAIGLEMF
ncbi:MAG TPA: tryptophan--tRNA ligase [Bacilli bacterium]|nr:tryptophan--tRNA ligase [Bacilli bacterium]